MAQASLENYPEDELKLLEGIYKKYHKPLYFFILNKTGDEETAWDLVHDCFAGTISARIDLSSEKAYRCYLYTSASNLCRMRFRSKNNVKQASFDKLKDDGKAFADQRENHEKKLEFEQLEKVITQLVHQMPEKEQSIFLMKKRHDMTLNEISKITDLSQRQLIRILKKCVENILTELQKMGFIYDGELI